MITGRQAEAEFRRRTSQANDLLASYRALETEISETIGKLETDLRDAQLALAAAYLRELSSEAFARVERLTGFVGFERRDPFAAMAHERKSLESTVARIAADERYQRRELLVGPSGTLTQKVEEAREQRAPWQDECATFESQPGFAELIASGYDTPHFQASWWQANYWKLWAAGDRITKALGKEDFGDDVLPAYQRCAEQRAFWDGEIATIEAAIAEVHLLVQNRDHAAARLPQLPSIYLGQSQEYLADYLREADLILLEEWAKERADNERAVLSGLRRVAGMAAKVAYMRELQGRGLRKITDSLAEQSRKFSRKASKFARPKHASGRFHESIFSGSYDDAVAKHRLRQEKMRNTVSQVVAYDDYDRFALSNPPELWWFEFTGRPAPTYVPQLRSWYDRNQQLVPTYDGDRDELIDSDAESAVALAAASRDLDDAGYLS